MSFDNKEKNENKTPLTELTRIEYYKDSDQVKYSQLYQELIDNIVKMLAENKSLFDIYEYARVERGNIAKELKHPDQGDFGIVRDKVGGDVYDSRSYAGTRNLNYELFRCVKNALPEQSSFRRRDWTPRDKLVYCHDHFFYHGDVDLLTNQKKEYQDEMYLDMVVETTRNGRVTEILEVKVIYCIMNQNIYQDRIKSLEKELMLVKNCEEKSKEALYNVFKLVHALSRDIYVKRGSAAINGAILRALAKIKGFDLKALNIRGLSFDVYAHMIANPDLYAKICVAEVAEAYKLFMEPNLESGLKV